MLRGKVTYSMRRKEKFLFHYPETNLAAKPEGGKKLERNYLKLVLCDSDLTWSQFMFN